MFRSLFLSFGFIVSFLSYGQFNLQLNQVLLVSNSLQTVPVGKVWKVESFMQAGIAAPDMIETGGTCALSDRHHPMIVNGQSYYLINGSPGHGSSGVFLAVIFTAFSYMIAIFNPDKVKGIGIALLSWLVLSVVYDGLFLIYLMVFSEYPVEKHAIVIALLNPIDLARIMTMLKLDIAALLGYTGAVFKSFFGSYLGLMLSTLAMLFWAVFPFVFISRKGNKRDF